LKKHAGSTERHYDDLLGAKKSYTIAATGPYDWSPPVLALSGSVRSPGLSIARSLLDVSTRGTVRRAKTNAASCEVWVKKSFATEEQRKKITFSGYDL
jgi:hypothetical protein